MGFKKGFVPKELSNDAQRALDSIAWYLGRRDHSEFELRQKLGRRYTPGAIDGALDQANERNWLAQPEELAMRWSAALACKGKSHRYIQNFLRKKRLPEPARSDDEEITKAVQILRQKFARNFADSQTFSFELQQKAYRFLAYRGFDQSTIKKAVHEVARSPLELY